MNTSSQPDIVSIRHLIERDSEKLYVKRHEGDALRVGESVSLGMALKALCHTRKHGNGILDYVEGMDGPEIDKYVSYFRRSNQFFGFMLEGPILSKTEPICFGRTRRAREKHNIFAVMLCLAGRKVFEQGDFYDRWLFAAEGYADGPQYKAITNHLGECASNLLARIPRIFGTRETMTFNEAKNQMAGDPHIRSIIVQSVKECFPPVRPDWEAAILSAPSPSHLPPQLTMGMVVAPAAEPSRMRLGANNSVTVTGFPGHSLLVTPAAGMRACITVHGTRGDGNSDGSFIHLSSPAVVGTVQEWANLTVQNPPSSILAINGTLPGVTTYTSNVAGTVVEDAEEKVVNKLRQVMADAQTQALLNARGALHAVRAMVWNMETEYATQRGRDIVTVGRGVSAQGRRRQRMTQDVLVEAMLRNAPAAAAELLRQAQELHYQPRGRNPVTGTPTAATDLVVLERAAGSALQWIAAAPTSLPESATVSVPVAGGCGPSTTTAPAGSASAAVDARLLLQYKEMVQRGSLKHYANTELNSPRWEESSRDTFADRRQREQLSRRLWLKERKGEMQWVSECARHLWEQCVEIEMSLMESASGCGRSPWSPLPESASEAMRGYTVDGSDEPTVVYATVQGVASGNESSAPALGQSNTPPPSSCVAVGPRSATPPPRRHVEQHAYLRTSSEEVARAGVAWRPEGGTDSDLSPLRDMGSGLEDYHSGLEAGVPGPVFLPRLTEELQQVAAGEPTTPPYSDGDSDCDITVSGKRPVDNIPELEKMLGCESVFDERACVQVLTGVKCATSTEAMGWRGGGKKCVGWQDKEVAIYGCPRCVSVALR